jgi:hypothetical protein
VNGTPQSNLKERMDRVRVKKYRAIKPRRRTGSIKDEGVSE